MSPFWKGFFSVFTFPSAPKTNLYEKYKPKEFQWYEPVENWWEHSMWGDTWKQKKDRD